MSSLKLFGCIALFFHLWAGVCVAWGGWSLAEAGGGLLLFWAYATFWPTWAFLSGVHGEKPTSNGVE